jgi:glycosyltransferase involved in cell wall biosynthesis
MHLLFVIDCLGSGGAQRQLVNLALGLINRGHSVEFFVYHPHKDHFLPQLKENRIAIHAFKKSRRYSLSVIKALHSLIKHESYDLILSFLPTPNFYTVVAGLTVRSHPPLIVSERSSDIGKKIYFTDKVARNLYRFASHVVVNSHHQREHLIRKYPFLEKKSSTIYNGYDLNWFSPQKNTSFAPYQKLSLLVIGNISPGKNGLCLVRALKILHDSFKLSPVVSWVGDLMVSGARLQYKEKMENEIREYGLMDQWHWLGQRADIVKLLNHHDVLIHPSYIEGLPNVVCEALACGRPVIVSDVLDHQRLVQDGITGFLFDWRNPADLAEKIYQFATLSEKTKIEMGCHAREFARRNLSLERYVQEFETLMENCL